MWEITAKGLTSSSANGLDSIGIVILWGFRSPLSLAFSVSLPMSKRGRQKSRKVSSDRWFGQNFLNPTTWFFLWLFVWVLYGRYQVHCKLDLSRIREPDKESNPGFGLWVLLQFWNAFWTKLYNSMFLLLLFLNMHFSDIHLDLVIS